jgi:hypothetical protein
MTPGDDEAIDSDFFISTIREHQHWCAWLVMWGCVGIRYAMGG